LKLWGVRGEDRVHCVESCEKGARAPDDQVIMI